MDELSAMNLLALPAFTDNYIWMLHDGHHAIVVDPGDSVPVLSALTSLKLTLTGILVTHHHRDHVAGLAALQPVLQGPVYGPAEELIAEVSRPVNGGQSLYLLERWWQVLDVPGHTLGQIAYYSPQNHRGEDAPVLFCGDSLFSAGCGRLFEGSPKQMHDSLQRLAKLPPDTQVCCAHEYTLSNLRFAQAVEPGNRDIDNHIHWCAQQRARGAATLPSHLAQELRINPFLRCTEPTVIDSALNHGASSSHSLDVFTALRQWKNEF